MGGSSAEKNAAFEFLHFGETSSTASGFRLAGETLAGETPLVSPAALPLPPLPPRLRGLCHLLAGVYSLAHLRALSMC
jgi:hypothetical protein